MAGDGDDDALPPAPPAALARPPVAASSLSEQLLLQVLTDLNAVDRRVARGEAQNDIIIAGQARAEQSRAETHKRVNEIAVNVAGLEVNVEKQGERLDALDPIVAGLKEAGLEQRVIRKVVLAVCKNGYARAGGAALAGGALLHQWETLRDFTVRILHLKTGG